MADFQSFVSPTKNFGGLKFDTMPNPANQWQSYLSGLTNQKDIEALGLGSTEDANTQSEAWNRWLSGQAESMSPNALNALNQNKWRFDSAFRQAAATSPEPLRYAQFLGGVNSKDTAQSLSPYQAFRPVTFYRVKSSFNN